MEWEEEKIRGREDRQLNIDLVCAPDWPWSPEWVPGRRHASLFLTSTLDGPDWLIPTRNTKQPALFVLRVHVLSVQSDQIQTDSM